MYGITKRLGDHKRSTAQLKLPVPVLHNNKGCSYKQTARRWSFKMSSFAFRNDDALECIETEI